MRRAGALALALLAGCGSRGAAELPPAAEPARAPRPSEPPAGRVVTVGSRPEGIAFEPRTRLVAVGLRDPDLLALLDPRDGHTVARLALPESPRHLQPGPPGTVLVPAEGGDRLVQVRLPDGQRVQTEVGDQPHDATYVDGRIYVGEERASSVTVVAPSGRRTGAFRTALQPGGVLGVAPGRLGLVAVRQRVLDLYAAPSGRRLARVPAGVGPTHLAGDGENLVWVVDTMGNAVLQYHLRPKLELARRARVPGRPYGVAFDPRRRRLYVTQTERNQITELDVAAGLHTVRRYPTVRQPDTVAVDPSTGRLFITGKLAGAVQLLDPIGYGAGR